MPSEQKPNNKPISFLLSHTCETYAYKYKINKSKTEDFGSYEPFTQWWNIHLPIPPKSLTIYIDKGLQYLATWFYLVLEN